MNYYMAGPSGDAIGLNLRSDCHSCLTTLQPHSIRKQTCSANGHTYRQGKMESLNGMVFLCSDLQDDINSARVFRARLAAYLASLGHIARIRAELEEASNVTLKRVMHNLMSLNAHAIQDVFALISQDALTGDIRRQQAVIESVIRTQPAKAARTLLRIAKNNMAVKTEFAVIRLLDQTSPPPTFKFHALHRVILNVLHTVLPDFTENNVHANISDCSLSVPLDYETFQAALYHILENATKYVLPNSELFIRFSDTDSEVHITFDMHSLYIAPDEVSRIGEERFSGAEPKRIGRAGHGMGMFRTKKLLGLNDGDLIVRANVMPDSGVRYAGALYERNQFIIVLRESERRTELRSEIRLRL